MNLVFFAFSVMHNKYTRDTDKLRAWHSACHVDRPKRSRTASGEPAVQGAEAAAAASK